MRSKILSILFNPFTIALIIIIAFYSWVAYRGRPKEVGGYVYGKSVTTDRGGSVHYNIIMYTDTKCYYSLEVTANTYFSHKEKDRIVFDINTDSYEAQCK